jgi:hypothetical protein
MSNINSFYDKKIIWLADYNICGDNFNYFKNQLITILRSLKELDNHVIETLNNIGIDLKKYNGCLLYVRFINRSTNIKYYSVDDYEQGDDAHLDALEAYQDFVDRGYSPLIWSDLIGNTTDTYDIFDKISESNEYSNVSHLINKKIWFDYPTEREDIEKVNQFFIDNGFRGLKSDNIDEFEDFIYDNDAAYFKLTQHTSPLHSVEERRPYIDYFSLDWTNPERLKNDPSFIYYQDILNMTDTTLDILSNLNESVEEMQPKIGDYLYCHKEVVMDDGSKETTVGKFYQIKNVMRDRLEILNDHRGDHAFGTNPKTDWYYGIWFHLIPKEHKKDFDSFNPEDIFNQLD